MNIIRPARLGDEKQLIELVAKSGLGIISLPHDPTFLHKKITDSVEAFKTETQSNHKKYFFVLENEGKIGGCSGIYARTGIEESADYFEIKYKHSVDPIKQQPVELKILERVSPFDGPSMLCSLFVAPEFRKGSFGRLLSLSRLMFMARFPKLFTKTVIANLRGFVENKQSPFWEGVGRHFYDVDYDVFLQMQEVDRKNIPDFMPHTPLYTCLLTTGAQEAMGKTHPNTLPALIMLEGEGFVCKHLDLYDAGPMVSAELTDIRTVKLRQTRIVGKIANPKNTADKWLISNSRYDFRACYGYLDTYNKEHVCIDSAVAEGLKVKVGDTIHYVSLH